MQKEPPLRIAFAKAVEEAPSTMGGIVTCISANTIAVEEDKLTSTLSCITNYSLNHCIKMKH
jgi:hypothetical protein